MGRTQDRLFGSSSPLAAMVRQRALRIASSAVLLAASTGCYVYAPSGTGPQPGQQVALVITDQGRVALASQVGAGVTQLAGTLVSISDGEYLLRVTDVRFLQGNARWSGERVVVRQDHVSGVLHRRFSKGRTLVAVTTAVVSASVLLVARDLIGFGTPGRSPTPNPPEQQ